MFCLTTFISSLFLINSNNSDIKNVRLNLYPSVEELKNLKEKDLKEFNRKMKARQEVWNIGKSWSDL